MDSQEALGRVRQWLSEEGIAIEEPGAPAMLWQLRLKDSQLVTYIQQPSAAPDKIAIGGALVIDDATRRRIAKLDARARADLLWTIRMDLLRSHVHFQIQGAPLERVLFETSVYFDGLTKDRLMRRWHQLRSAILLVMWTMNRRFDQPPRLVPVSDAVN